MQTIDEFLESIFGTMAILAISIAVVLAIVVLVLIEISWIVRLWTNLSKHWNRTLSRVAQESGESKDLEINKSLTSTRSRQ